MLHSTKPKYATLRNKGTGHCNMPIKSVEALSILPLVHITDRCRPSVTDVDKGTGIHQHDLQSLAPVHGPTLLGSLPDNMAPKEVSLQQEVVHQCHEQQQCCKAASNEGHKVGQLSQRRGGELLQILLSCFVAGVQPAHVHGSTSSATDMCCTVCRPRPCMHTFSNTCMHSFLCGGRIQSQQSCHSRTCAIARSL